MYIISYVFVEQFLSLEAMKDIDFAIDCRCCQVNQVCDRLIDDHPLNLGLYLQLFHAALFFFCPEG